MVMVVIDLDRWVCSLLCIWFSFLIEVRVLIFM